MSADADTPVIAVVGHPNKGKSSLVATLAHDAHVRIAPEPGTTTRATRYPLRLDGETLYVLVDTPGFQRARRALAWMREEAERTGASAADRPAIVARFLEAPGHRKAFPDEVELLAPVVAGAGILYVVSGSVPFGSEYEAEMEILRWTGRPSLAVINPIETDRHVEQWRTALGQFFKAVRVLDAVHADFETQVDLLRTFAELDEGWRPSLRRAADALEAERERQLRRAASEIAGMLIDAAALSVEERIPEGSDPESRRGALEARYRDELRRLERRGRRAVEAVYAFDDLDVEEPAEAERETERALLEQDLFSEDTWLVFGLRRRDLVAAGAAAGATTGGAIDVAVGGASLLLGAAVGGAVGGALGWLGGDRLARLEVMHRPLGGALARLGPTRGPAIPAVLLGRARLHHDLVRHRTHARRDRLRLHAPGGPDGPEDPGAAFAPSAAEARRLDAALRRGDAGRGRVERLVAELLARPAQT